MIAAMNYAMKDKVCQECIAKGMIKPKDVVSKLCMSIKVQWFWNVAYPNPEMQYLDVKVDIINNF